MGGFASGLQGQMRDDYDKGVSKGINKVKGMFTKKQGGTTMGYPDTPDGDFTPSNSMKKRSGRKHGKRKRY